MLCIRIIPCLDVRDGRVVKGIRFQNLRDAGSPAERARLYEEEGADEVVILDVSATPEGRRTQADTVRAVRQELSIPLTVGGGVKEADDARRLLEAGADKVSINTAAVRDPELVRTIAGEFGRQCTVLAVDAARVMDEAKGSAASPLRWEVVVLSGTERTGIDVLQWVEAGVQRGAGEILLTSWDRDGTRSGYDVELLRAVAGRVNVPIIASGGAATTDHLYRALEAGADAVLAASIFHDGERSVNDLKDELASLGIRVRR